MLMTLRPPVMRQPAGSSEPSQPTRDDEEEGASTFGLEDEIEPVETADQEPYGPFDPDPAPGSEPETSPGPTAARAPELGDEAPLPEGDSTLE
jgi:hypothetical protein